MNTIKTLIIFFIILSILLSILISILLLFYYLFQKYNIKKNIQKYIFFKQENMQNFDASNVVANNYLPHNLGNIFKHNNMNFNEYPYVEIKPNEPLFSNNKILPECCLYNNEYSTDKGCPCITPDQQYYLKRRGINKDKNNYNINLNNLNNDNNISNLYFSPSLAIKGENFPFNPLTSKKYNINYIGDPPEQSDASLNEFYLMTNFISHSIEKNI